MEQADDNPFLSALAPTATAALGTNSAAGDDFAERLDRYAAAGLEVSVSLEHGVVAEVAEGPATARTTRALTRAAFNLDGEREVTEAHLAQMAWANGHDPALARAFLSGDVVLEPGTTFSLAGTQRGLETADAALTAAIEELGRSITHLESSGPPVAGAEAAEALAPLRALQDELERALAATRDMKLLAGAELALRVARGRAARAGSLQAVHDAFRGPSELVFDPGTGSLAGYREVRDHDPRSVAARVDVLLESGRRERREVGALLQRKLQRAEAEALADYGARALAAGSYLEARAAFAEALTLAGPLREDAVTAGERQELVELALAHAQATRLELHHRLSLTPGGARSPEAARAERQALSAAYDRALEERRWALTASTGEARRQAQVALSALQVDRALALAGLAQAQGSPLAGRDLLDALALSLPGQEAIVGRVFGAGRAAPDRADLAALRGAVAASPEGLRARSVEILEQLGALAASQEDRPRLDAAIVLLGALEESSADPHTLRLARVHQEELGARQDVLAGDLFGAEEHLLAMRHHAEHLASSGEREELIGRAVFLEVQVRARHALLDRRSAGARLEELRAVRASAEAAGLPAAQIAACLALEVEVGVSLDEHAFAEAAYRELSQARFAGVEPVARVQEQMKRTERSGAVAFAEVALSEWGRSTLGESALFMGGGAAGGAALGLYLGGPPGAALGALVGTAAGGLFLGSWNLGMRGGWERAVEAARLGRSGHSATEDALNLLGFALDVAPLPALGRAATRLGGKGLTVMLRGATGGEAAEEWLSGMRQVVRAEAQALGRELSPVEVDSLVREALLKKFGREFAGFAATPQGLLSLGALGGAFGAQFAEIYTGGGSEAEKAAAYAALAEQMGESALGVALLLGSAGAIEHLALGARGPHADLMARLEALLVAPPRLVLLDDAAYLAQIERRRAAAPIAEQGRYQALAEGAGFFDPVSGQIYLRASTSPADLPGVAQHELVHRAWHQLGDEPRAAVEALFRAHPAWPELRRALEVEPALRGRSDAELVDELLPRVLAQPDHYPELRRLAEPILGHPALASVGLDRAPVVDVDRLLQDRALVVEQSQYHRGSMESTPVAAPLHRLHGPPVRRWTPKPPAAEGERLTPKEQAQVSSIVRRLEREPDGFAEGLLSQWTDRRALRRVPDLERRDRWEALTRAVEELRVLADGHPLRAQRARELVGPEGMGWVSTSATQPAFAAGALFARVHDAGLVGRRASIAAVTRRIERLNQELAALVQPLPGHGAALDAAPPAAGTPSRRERRARPAPEVVTPEVYGPLAGTRRRADFRVSGRRFAGEYMKSQLALARSLGIEVRVDDPRFQEPDYQTAAAMFQDWNPAGRAPGDPVGTIYLRRGASRLEWFHEFAHARQFLELGYNGYNAPENGTFERELYVFREVKKNSALFNPHEYEHSRQYVLGVAKAYNKEVPPDVLAEPLPEPGRARREGLSRGNGP